MPLVIWLMTTRRQLLFCCLNLVLLIGTSFVVFYFWPTSVARPEPSPGHDFFYGVIFNADLPRNACPSLHAAFGVFTAIGAWQVFRGWQHSWWLIGAAWLWTAAVLLSTLLIKQHVFLDLLAGIALGAASGWLTQRPERLARRCNPACLEVVSQPPMRAAASLPASPLAPKFTAGNSRPPGGQS
jgi:membrane-associated phospholipid phosphatase